MDQVQRRRSLGSFAKKPNEDKLDKRRYIAKEIIDTERTYVQNLTWIVEVTETAHKMSHCEEYCFLPHLRFSCL